MFSNAEKTSKPATTLHLKSVGQAFVGRQLSLPQTTNHPADTAMLRQPQLSKQDAPLAPSFIQPKLSVSTPGDAYEREADATAAAVMSMNDTAAPSTTIKEEQVQRQEEEQQQEEQEENKVQGSLQLQVENQWETQEQTLLHQTPSTPLPTGSSQPAGEDTISNTTTSIQPLQQTQQVALQNSGRGPPIISPRFEQTLQQQTAGGNTLPAPTQQFMESRFGANFSGVRIHTDAAAQHMSSSIRAHAFTYRNHIFFNSGKFEPATTAGNTLLAHELTHTIQQGASPLATAPPTPGLQLSEQVSNTEEAAEHQEIENDAQASDLQLSNWGVLPNGNVHDQTNVLPATLATTGVVPTGHAAPTTNSFSGQLAGNIHNSAIQLHEQTHGQEMLQGGWLDEAWDAVSGVVDEAASWVEEGIDAAKNWLLGKVRDFVMQIPGYQLLCYILGRDPITHQPVIKTPETLLSAVVGFIPFYGHLILPVLQYFNATVPVANWLFNEANQLGDLIENIGVRFQGFWNTLTLDDIADPDGVMRSVANLFTSIVQDMLSFVANAAQTFLQMVKAIALRNLGEFIKTHFPQAFDLLCVVLGQNPVTQAVVLRNGTNILNAGLNILGERGVQIKQQIEQNGIHAQAVAWVDRAILVVIETVSDIAHLFTNVWQEINFQTLFTPLETFSRIAAHFTRPINRVVSFVSDAVIALLRLLKNALLAWLSRTAASTRGYYLITVILGRDPFTGEVVERNVENIIHGFMSLMEGGEEQFQQMKQTGAIARTTQKINAAVASLNFSVGYFVALFSQLWQSMDWTDLLYPLAAFGRILNTFAQPIRRLIIFVAEIVKIVVEVLLVVMHFPIDVVQNIFRRMAQIMGIIRRDPIGFLINLLRGIKQGFVQFFNNILTHLMRGLSDWLFGQLGAIGIQVPPDLSFRSILQLVLQVLGITVQQIMDRVWQKLTERIGAERVAKIRRMAHRLEGIWRFVRDVMERGPIAIWEYLQQQLSNLWNTVIDSIKNWIMERIINAAIGRLLSMLDPTGIMAVINSVMAIYRAIQSFVAQLRQLLEIVNSFVNGVAEIATGNVVAAANYLERTAARFIPVMIGFLANQIGLSQIASRIVEMIASVRTMVTNALDWLINRAINLGMPIINSLLAMIEGGEQLLERGTQVAGAVVSGVMGWLGFREQFTLQNGEQHTMYVRDNGQQPSVIIESTPTELPAFFLQKETEIQAHTTMDAAEKRQRIGRISHGRNLMTGLQAMMNTSKTTHTNNPRIPQVLAQLSQLVREIDPSGQQQVVPAPIITPGFTNTKATQFSVRNLYKGAGAVPRNHAAGSAPSDANLVDSWQVLRDMQLSSRWVRFHILNEKLGGIASDSNLIPTPSYINNEYRTELEDDLKRYYRMGLPIWLQANITYRPGYNQLFVNHFSARAGALKFQNNAWVEDAATSKQFSKSIDAPTPVAYNINRVLADAGEETLLVNTSTMSRNMVRLLRSQMPPSGYSFYRQMERVLATAVFGRPMLSMDHEYVEAQGPTAEQRNTINNYRRGLSSANWSF